MTSLDPHPLSGDLVPWIADPAIHAAVVTLTRVDLKPLPGSVPPTAGGTVHARVDEVISSASLAPRDLLDMPAQQVIEPLVRLRNTVDHWNALDLAPGRRWLLLCHAPVGSGQTLALAATEVPPSDPQGLVPALRSAFELERSARARRPDPEAFVQAMSAPNDTLHRYARDAIVGRHLFGRDAGAQLLERAWRAKGLAGARAVEAAGVALRLGLFARPAGADAANVRVLGWIAGGLVAESDPALRVRWARLLTSATLGEFADDPQRDAQTRRQLLHAVTLPAAADVVAALEQQVRQADETGRPLLQRAIEAWRTSR